MQGDVLTSTFVPVACMSNQTFYWKMIGLVLKCLSDRNCRLHLIGYINENTLMWPGKLLFYYCLLILELQL